MLCKLMAGVCGVFLLNLLFLPRAYAYIDPGTGAMLLQAVAAAGVATLVFGKRIYFWVRGLFVKTDSAGDAGNESGD